MTRPLIRVAGFLVVAGLIIGLPAVALDRGDTRDGARIESCTLEYGRAVAKLRIHNATGEPAMFAVRVRLNDSVEMLQAQVGAGDTIHERMVGWEDINDVAVCVLHSVERVNIAGAS